MKDRINMKEMSQFLNAEGLLEAMQIKLKIVIKLFFLYLVSVDIVRDDPYLRFHKKNLRFLLTSPRIMLYCT